MELDDELNVVALIAEALESADGFRTYTAKAHTVLLQLEEAGWEIVARDPGPPLTDLEHDLLKSLNLAFAEADGTVRRVPRRWT